VAWGNYLDNLYREQSKLYADIQSARKLGLSETEIRKNLINKAKLGSKEVNMIMQGKFFPTAATRELAKEINAMRKAEGRSFVEGRVPFNSFNAMSRQRVGESLGGVDVNPPSPAAPTQVSPSVNPYLNLAPQVPAAPANPYLNITPQRQGSLPVAPAPVQTASAVIDPIVLGNDPATQALARSLGRSQ